MNEHRFTEGAIRDTHIYRYCEHCDLMLFYYKGSKTPQVFHNSDREYYADLARKFNVE